MVHLSRRLTISALPRLSANAAPARRRASSIRVGGGLSAQPHLAVRLNAFVEWTQVLPVIRGVAEIFRSADILRDSRERARLKFLFLEQGWTADRFQQELENRIGFRLNEPSRRSCPPISTAITPAFIRRSSRASVRWSYRATRQDRPETNTAAANLADRFASGDREPPACRSAERQRSRQSASAGR